MAAVLIKLDQTGKPVGVAGQAREDLDLGTDVTATAVGGPFFAYQWSLIYKPPNAAMTTPSAAVAATPSATATVITPIDNAGSYLVELLVDSGAGLGATPDDIARITFYAGAALSSTPSLLPRRRIAFSETTEHNVPDALSPGGNPQGWAREWERWFRYIEAAASVDYVNAVVAGLHAKEVCRLLATSNIALTGIQVIDTISTVTGDRIYVIGQTNPIENGIYVADDGGAWTRSVDMPAGSSGAGVYAFVSEGAVDHADRGWLCSTDAPVDIVGTDPLAFVLFTTLQLANVAPLDVTKSAALIGVSVRAAREDHKHNLVVDSDDVDWVGGVIPGPPTNLTEAIQNLAPDFLLKSVTSVVNLSTTTLLTLDLDDVPNTVLQTYGEVGKTAVGSVLCEIVAAIYTGHVAVFRFQISRINGGNVTARALSRDPVSTLNCIVLVNDGATLQLQVESWPFPTQPVLAVMSGYMQEKP